MESRTSEKINSDFETESRIDNGFKNMRFNIIPGQEFMMRTKFESERFRGTFS